MWLTGGTGDLLLPEPLLSLKCRALSLHLGSPETQALLKREGDREGRARVVQAPLPYPVFVKFRGSATADGGGQAPGSGCLSCWRDGVLAPDLLLPHYLFPWTLLWLSGWSCVCNLSCCSEFSLDLGSIAMVRGLCVQKLSLLFPQFHLLCVIPSTCL